MGSFWESCLQHFEQELPVQQFNTWIKPLRLEGEDSPLEGLRLIAPNGFIMKWIRDRYLTRIEDYGRSYFAQPVSIALVIDGAPPGSIRPNLPEAATGAPRGSDAVSGKPRQTR
jgi:chromosomal replication initiator protein